MFLHLLTSGEEGNKALISFLNAFLIIEPATFYRGSGVAEKGGKAVLKVTGIPERKPALRPLQPGGALNIKNCPKTFAFGQFQLLIGTLVCRYGDCAGFCFGPARDADRQQAVFETCRNLFAVDVFGERKAARKVA